MSREVRLLRGVDLVGVGCRRPSFDGFRSGVIAFFALIGVFELSARTFDSIFSAVEHFAGETLLSAEAFFDIAVSSSLRKAKYLDDGFLSSPESIHRQDESDFFSHNPINRVNMLSI